MPPEEERLERLTLAPASSGAASPPSQRVAEGSGAAIDPAALEKFLAGTALFSRCDASVVAKVASRLELVDVRPGQLVLRSGESGAGVCLLGRGRLTVRMMDVVTGESTVCDILRPGDHFGEIGALLRGAQPFAVVAEEPSRIARIPADVVEALLARIPGFGEALARRLAMRIVQTSMLGARPRAATLPPPPPSGVPDSTARPVGAGHAGPIVWVQVADFEPPPAIVGMVPARMIHQHQLLPLELRGNVMTVGMVNPRNGAAFADLKRVLPSVELRVVAIALDDFGQAVVRLKLMHHADRKSSASGSGIYTPENLVFDGADAEREPDRVARVIGEEVVLLVNRVLLAAIEREASDIHIEPDAQGVTVRFRVNGVLHDWAEALPLSFAKGVVARLKVLAGLDITERRVPQDGRIGVRVGRREIDLRLSTLPASRGEKVVLRVLESATILRPLDRVFIEPGTLAAVRRVLNRPFGAIVVAGPTGSGKSSTLYATLHERRRTRPDSNILMVEDPIEYRLSGVTQIQVNHAVGLGFAQVLRAMLRQDPDVIMVGEVRDAETAQLALEAAMTGHLLFTSIHANDAFSVVQRLENLGCSRTHIAQSLALVLVQRLARRLCPSCVKLDPPAPVLVESLVARGLIERGTMPALPRPLGCDACQQTGFQGRVAVVESLLVNDDTRLALMAGVPLAEIQRSALEAGRYVPFARYASYLMSRKLIGPSDALLTVTE